MRERFETLRRWSGDGRQLFLTCAAVVQIPAAMPKKLWRYFAANR
jgi:hypothetical protein